MQRRKFLRTAALGPAALRPCGTLAAPAIAQSMPELNWRLTSSFPKSLDTLYGAGERLREDRRRDDRQQVPDPHLRGRRDRARPAGARCRAERHGRDGPYAPATYYVGKDPTFAFDTAVPFGLNTRQQDAWMNCGGGEQLLNDFYKDYNVYGIAVRQHRRADGRLVPQGDQDASTT